MSADDSNKIQLCVSHVNLSIYNFVRQQKLGVFGTQTLSWVDNKGEKDDLDSNPGRYMLKWRRRSAIPQTQKEYKVNQKHS